MIICLRCKSPVDKCNFALPNGYNGELEDDLILNCPNCGGLTQDEVKFVSLTKGE